MNLEKSNPLERDELIKHLTLIDWGPDKVAFTGLVAALRDAREATKRNPDNGEKEPDVNHGNWLGTYAI